jgi:hypothetical protein
MPCANFFVLGLSGKENFFEESKLCKNDNSSHFRKVGL